MPPQRWEGPFVHVSDLTPEELADWIDLADATSGEQPPVTLRRVAAEITVVCSICGEVKVGPAALSMLLYPDNTGHYIFRCPVCREIATRPASARVVCLLRSVAVQESRIRPRTNPATALTEDDLIAFGRAIENDETDPWSELGAGVATP